MNTGIREEITRTRGGCLALGLLSRKRPGVNDYPVASRDQNVGQVGNLRPIGNRPAPEPKTRVANPLQVANLPHILVAARSGQRPLARSVDFSGPTLENGLHLLAELIRQGAVDEPVVERQRQVRLAPDGYRIALDNGRNLFYRPYAEDRDLRLVNARRGGDAAKAAE